MRILRALSSRALPCGCLAGIYETYSSQTVAIIDATGTDCGDRAHRVNARIDFHQIDVIPEAPGATHARPKI